MKRISLLLMAFIALFISCGGHDDPEPDPDTGPAEQTILMYMPWAGDDLYPYLLKNINAMETAIINNGGLGNKKLMVFLCINPTRSMLISVDYNKGECVRDTLEHASYGTIEPSYTTVTGISDIFNKVKASAPARSYALIVGCHALGWLPKGTSVTSYFGLSKSTGSYHPRYVPVTRFYGNSGDERQQAEITTLATAVKQSFGKTDYILFDNCYMSGIEVAYDLKDATDYLIASPTEVLGDGMPYATVGRNLLKGDYNGVVDGFYNYYKNYTITFKDGHTEDYSCGTLAVINCEELDAMASLMKTINSQFTFDAANREKVQVMDGIEPTIFFDMGDYLDYLCPDASLLSQAKAQLDKVVPYKRSTGMFYSTYNEQKTLTSKFSGITISDPTNNSKVTKALTTTAWWKASH